MSDWCGNSGEATFVDVSKVLLGENGRPISRYYQPDFIHLNAGGYALWTDILARTPNVAVAFGGPRGCLHRSNTSMTIMRPPQLGHGGRKEIARDLRAWLSVRGDVPVPQLFLNARGGPMTRAGFEYVLDKHVRKAAKTCASLRDRSVSPHQLRHYLPRPTMSGR